MNEHIRKGDEALELEDLQTAEKEFRLAKNDSSLLTRRIAEDRLKEIKKRKSSERKAGENPKTQTEWDRPEIGWLSYLGYRVGEKGIPKTKRREILKEAFFLTIPTGARFSKKQVDRWGIAGSKDRFAKLRSWLEFRINSNHDKSEMAEAIADWRDDLKWFETEFIKEVFPEKDSE